MAPEIGWSTAAARAGATAGVGVPSFAKMLILPSLSWLPCWLCACPRQCRPVRAAAGRRGLLAAWAHGACIRPSGRHDGMPACVGGMLACMTLVTSGDAATGVRLRASCELSAGSDDANAEHAEQEARGTGGGPFLIFGSGALHTARVQTSSTPDVRSQNRVRRVFQQAVRAACPGEAAFPRTLGLGAYSGAVGRGVSSFHSHKAAACPRALVSCSAARRPRLVKGVGAGRRRSN